MNLRMFVYTSNTLIVSFEYMDCMLTSGTSKNFRFLLRSSKSWNKNCNKFELRLHNFIPIFIPTFGGPKWVGINLLYWNSLFQFPNFNVPKVRIKIGKCLDYICTMTTRNRRIFDFGSQSDDSQSYGYGGGGVCPQINTALHRNCRHTSLVFLNNDFPVHRQRRVGFLPCPGLVSL